MIGVIKLSQGEIFEFDPQDFEEIDGTIHLKQATNPHEGLVLDVIFSKENVYLLYFVDDEDIDIEEESFDQGNGEEQPPIGKVIPMYPGIPGKA